MTSTINKIFFLLNSQERKKLYFLLGLTLVMSVLELAGIVSVMPFVAVVVNPEIIETNKWVKLGYEILNLKTYKSYLLFLGVLVLFLIILTNIFKALNDWFLTKFCARKTYDLSTEMFKIYLKRPYEYYINKNTFKLSSYIITETKAVVQGIINPMLKVVINLVITGYILILLVLIDPGLSMTLGFALVVFYIFLYYFVRIKLINISRTKVKQNALCLKSISESFQGIKDIKFYGREMFFLRRYMKSSFLLHKLKIQLNLISQLPGYAFDTIAFACVLVIVLFLMLRGDDMKQVFPLIALYSFAARRMIPAYQQIYSGITKTRSNLSSLDTVYDELFLEKNKSSQRSEFQTNQQNTEITAIKLKKSININNLSYNYPGSNNDIVDKISLKISVKSMIGIVGTTGSGKTTTVDIISGLLYPTSGKLSVDDTVINGDNIRMWQKNLGYVSQQVYIFDDTIERNIALGLPDEEIDKEAVIKAAKIANLHDFIVMELSKGYQTVVGERGIKLSGGQRQRLGIARALYNDPEVLVFDEATSALDGITEDSVMQAIAELTKKKTIIIIAHRITTLKECDVILVLEKGKIVAKGNYRELMQSSRQFKAMAKINE